MLRAFDSVFECADGFYTIGDAAHASWDAIGSLYPHAPGISGVYGALVVELSSQGVVALQVRPISRAQYDGELLIDVACREAVATNRVGLLAQGPMEIFTRGETLGRLGGKAGQSYWARWFCLVREPGFEKHFLGLYAEAVPGEPQPNDSLGEDPVARLAAIFDRDGLALIRTDFSDGEAWDRVVLEVLKPRPTRESGAEVYEPNVTPVDAPRFEGFDASEVDTEFSLHSQLDGYVALADGRSMSEAQIGGEITVALLDQSKRDEGDGDISRPTHGGTFRCIVTEVGTVEVNLALGNIDFEDFVDHVDSDGVFRGFRD